MHPFDHGLWRNITKYLFYTGRELLSNGTLLKPSHYQPILWLCFCMWKAPSLQERVHPVPQAQLRSLHDLGVPP